MMKIVICIEIDPSNYASYFITPSPCRSYLNFWVKVIWTIVYFYIYDWISSTLIIIISLSYALHTNSLSQNFGKWLIFQQQKLGHQKTPSASSFIVMVMSTRNQVEKWIKHNLGELTNTFMSDWRSKRIWKGSQSLSGTTTYPTQISISIPNHSFITKIFCSKNITWL